MYIKKCPKCGRIPVIKEAVSKTYRRRICCDPCYSSKLDQIKLAKYSCIETNPWDSYIYGHPWFIFIGEGDNNAIYKIWNEALIDE